MKRTILCMLIPLGIALLSCGSDDDVVRFPVGSWKLIAIVFENGSNKHELTSGRLNQMTIDFAADGSAISKTNKSEKTLNWTYDDATAGLQLSDGASTQAYTIEATDETVFRYEVANITTMGSPSADKVAMAELAANTYNQSKTVYDPTGSLKVYFKFEQL